MFYSNLTPDVLSWDDSNFYNTFYTKTQVNANFQSILSMNLYYTKANCDAQFQTISGMSSYLSTTAIANNYYSKSDIDNTLALYYNKIAVETRLKKLLH